MRRGVILGVLCAFGAGAAEAQTTACGVEFGKWVCRTQQPAPRPDIYQSGMDAFARGVEQGRVAREARERAQAAAAERYRQMDAERASAVATDVRQRVAEAVRTGDCAAAKELALRAGDLDLADQALRLCSN